MNDEELIRALCEEDNALLLDTEVNHDLGGPKSKALRPWELAAAEAHNSRTPLAAAEAHEGRMPLAAEANGRMPSTGFPGKRELSDRAPNRVTKHLSRRSGIRELSLV